MNDISSRAVSNGGMKVCRNHAQRLAEIADCDLTICTAGYSDNEANNSAFAAALGCRHIFVPFAPSTEAATSRWGFLYEQDAPAQLHVDRRMMEILDDIRPSTLMIDYFLSALFVPGAFRHA